MSKPRAPKQELESRTFKDGAIYLYRRKNSKKGVWNVRLKIPGHTGYIQRSSKTSNENDAYVVADGLYLDALVKVRTGAQPDTKRISTGIDAFIADHEQHDIDPNFKFTISLARKIKPFLKSYTFDDFNTVLVKKTLEFLALNSKKGSLAANTQRRNLSRLMAIAKWWYDEGYLSKIPSRPTLPSEKNRRPHFDDEAWAKLNLAITNWLKIKHGPVKRDRIMLANYVRILSNTGLRTGEAAKLRWKDIRIMDDPKDPDLKFFVLSADGKTGPRDVVARTMDVKKYFAEILKLRESELSRRTGTTGNPEIVSMDGFVFCHPDGKPIRSFKKSFASLLEFAGITYSDDGEKRTPYSLRHTYATFRLKHGVPAYALAQNMGTSVAMLEEHYGHTSNVSMGAMLTQSKKEKKRPKGSKKPKSTRPQSLDWLSEQ